MKKLYTRRVLLLILVLFFSTKISYAQVFGVPDPQFTAPCATLGFNTYNVEFNWSPPLVASDNQFILELSDGGGDFTNAIQLATVADSNTTFDIVFNFSFPTNTAGNNYRVRVRSTNPAMISDESFPFPAYYVNIDEPLEVNNFQDAVICAGASTLISVDNFPDEQLYNWYKDNVLIPSEKGPSLSINSTGLYYAEVDYGNFCSGNTASNIVEAIDGGAGSGEIATITSDETESCNLAVDITMTSSITDSNYTYTWYRDNIALTETSPTLVTAEEGVYFLEITIGVCPIYSNEIDIQECSTDPPDPSDITAIPNVLTPYREDGINDQWIIPSAYAFNPDVEVIIYGPTGEILHQTTAYENNWPQTIPVHIKNNPIFYYRILNGNEVLEQGSITLIK